MKYFIHDGQSELGPFTLDELKAQRVSPSTHIWYEGLAGWTTIGNVPELKQHLFSSEMPPPFQSSYSSEKSSFTPPPPHETAYMHPYPEKKSSFNKPVIITLVVIGVIVLAFLYRSNSDKSEVMAAVKETQNREDYEATRIASENKKYRAFWEKYILIEPGDIYVNYTLGGIDKFNVFVTNKTERYLDQVDVLVSYILKNTRVYKTEVISLFNIAPGTRESAPAPESSRGMNVKIEVRKILSKSMKFCYPQGQGAVEDPYYCE
jgi:hypothetical protein